MTRVTKLIKINTIIKRHMMEEQVTRPTSGYTPTHTAEEKAKQKETREQLERQRELESAEQTFRELAAELDYEYIPKNRPREPSAITGDGLVIETGESSRNRGPRILQSNPQASVTEDVINKVQPVSTFVNSAGNETCEVPKIIPFEIPILTREALLADATIRVTAAHIDELTTRLNIQMEKSETLKQDWVEHITTLDKCCKSLEGIRWKRVISWTACILTIIGFMWKMGALRAIPSFASNLIMSVPMPNTISVKETITQVPKPGLTEAYTALMDNPLGPIAIGATTLALGFGLGMLKASIWILRKMPK